MADEPEDTEDTGESEESKGFNPKLLNFPKDASKDADIATLRNFIESPTFAERIVLVAHIKHAMYVGYVSVGFSPQEALLLVKD